MYVKIECMILSVVTSRHHTILQELHLRIACTFRFDPVEIVFVKFLILQ